MIGKFYGRNTFLSSSPAISPVLEISAEVSSFLSFIWFSWSLRGLKVTPFVCLIWIITYLMTGFESFCQTLLCCGNRISPECEIKMFLLEFYFLTLIWNFPLTTIKWMGTLWLYYTFLLHFIITARKSWIRHQSKLKRLLPSRTAENCIISEIQNTFPLYIDKVS